MSSFTTYTETAVLNHLFRNVALPSPGSVRVALFTTAPTDAGGGTEASGSGYARQPVTFGAPTADSGKMKISNSAAVTFTAAGGGIGPVVAVGVFDAATGGMPVLGICNGFQVLCESHLLPGALVRNDHQRFICRDQELTVENTETAFSCAFEQGQVITIPLKNGEGQFVADERTLAELEGEGRVVFRYHGFNPNGSVNGIAGITNERGNVVGLMPHPEHAVETGYGPDGPLGPNTGTDGAGFFKSLIATVLS